ncbi:uncharacterized protein LOC132599591 isoform X2 [Lycium barbarum]|uniref:uncharacterized protein LOC132599591 isoform X2 n=1 Tax=Lycium barbarum TaxID=112863 RepID=UPI00293EAC17|nr:uncharacterized protein LOC132599591 isoform X2 [Lycium barbarum]
MPDVVPPPLLLGNYLPYIGLEKIAISRTPLPRPLSPVPPPPHLLRYKSIRDCHKVKWFPDLRPFAWRTIFWSNACTKIWIHFW